MTIHQTRTAPSRRVLPAAYQPGPVTLAIRNVRPNALPPREMHDHQIEEERLALRALRKRIADRIDADLAILDALDGDLDFEVTCEDEEDGHDREHDEAERGFGDKDGAHEQVGHAFGYTVMFS